MNERVETYIAYQATAEAITGADDSPELFLRLLFPDVSVEQIALMELYTIGKILDGIHCGLALSTENPISPLEAYRIGESDGFKRAILETRNRGDK